jgi:site-specific recombinase XerD
VARRSEGPWFRKAKNAWYVKINGRQVALGVGGKGNRKAAQDAFYRVMANGPGERPRMVVRTVRELVDAFLADAANRLKASTLEQYRADLEALTEAIGGHRADRITPADLTLWLSRQTVSDTTKAIRLRSASACFGWAVKCSWIDRNPVERMTRPKARSRSETAVIGQEDHVKLLAAASPNFKLVLQVLHGTGCRPGEAARITAENYYPDAGVARLNEHKADHTGRPRLIYLPADVAELLAKQRERYQTGPLLRTHSGNPWTGRSITEAMQKLKRKAGVCAMAYGYRHSFATDGLAKGLPEAHVAELLGHSSTAMLHKHYAHLTSRVGVMRNAASTVRPAG